MNNIKKATVIQSITIAELYVLEQIGIRVHTYRKPHNNKVVVYLSNLQDVTSHEVIINKDLSLGLKELLSVCIRTNQEVLTLI